MVYSLKDFDFHLPAEQIASEGLPERSASRMLRVDRSSGTFDDAAFSELPEILQPGDLLVLNNTRVFPARLYGETDTGASVEIFLVEPTSERTWRVLAKPGKRVRPGKCITFDEDLQAEVLEKVESGSVILTFLGTGDLDTAIDRLGRTPLPPYIKRNSDEADRDRERYQTVYAKSRGAIAAPTAGLHFTDEVLERLRSSGIETAEITLHVGYGTFEPVKVDHLADHLVQPERYSLREEAAMSLNTAKSEGRRIIAVGTTTTRTLEFVFGHFGSFQASSGLADLTILPGYRFRAIDGLLTNFHLPKSSLLVLVSTFGGHELIMNAYRHAVASGYRFYSYGDCMLIT